MRKVLLVLLLCFALAAIAWSASLMFGRHEANRAAAAPWPLSLGPLADVPGRYPRQKTSPAADALGPLEARLGIRLSRTQQPETADERAFDAIKAPLNGWLTAQYRSGSDAIAAPPPSVAAFLDEHRNDVDAVRAHIVAHADEMIWECDLTKLSDAPLPNLLAHFSVTKVLIATALLHREGDGWNDLQAAWLLNRVIVRRPELISQLIAIAVARMLAGAARKLPAPAPAWFGEIARVDWARNMAAAQQQEAWIFWAMARQPDSGHGILNFGFGPFMQLWAADLADRERAVVEHFASMRDCAVDGEAYDDRVKAAIPTFHTYSKVVMPAWGMTWSRVLRLRAEIEGATKVLELKRRAWPTSADDLLGSQCRDRSWSYANGALRISAPLPVLRPQVPLDLNYRAR